MSLIKQLWLAVIVVMLFALSGSLVLSVLSARHYLQQQLQLKNIDNATALALSLSQMEKDPVTIELQVAAQFDAGHYRFIRVVSPSGKVIVEKLYRGSDADVPAWFVRLVPIVTQPGQAQIQDGWKQYGTVTVASHDSYAYQSLWSGTLEMLLWFVLGGVLAGVVGTWALRLILRPLGDVVAQAEGIAQRRFQTVDEPRTPELRSVARAMNDMVARLKAMFAEEATRLEDLRRKVNLDAVTGLSSREYFLSHLREIVGGEQFAATGSLVLVGLNDLQQINAKLGHARTDQLLKGLGKVLYDAGNDRPGQRAGRVKGGEFAVVCPTLASPKEAAQDIHQRLMTQWYPQWSAELPELFHVAAVQYRREQSLGELLSVLGDALVKAQSQEPNGWFAVEGEGRQALPAEAWRTLLTAAVADGRLQLAFYPVVSGKGQGAIHQEGVIRLQAGSDGGLIPAGDFMPMAAHLNLIAPIDLQVVRLALEHLRSTQGDIAVNLSAEVLGDFAFRNALTQLLKSYADVCKRLLFEVPEYAVFRQFEAFRDLAKLLKSLGCRVGIEYFGQRFSESDKLADLGLDYIKVHPSYVRDLRNNAGNQEFLKGLCAVAHTLGIQVIALGVEDPADLPLLATLGFDGATGPGVRLASK
ncbi:MAG: EAL domain-containing protein [Rhodoferax sp.]